MGRPLVRELSNMLDAIAQTLAETAKPATPALVNTPNAAQVATQQTVIPVIKPAISAPETLPPAFLPEVMRAESKPQATTTSITGNPHTTAEVPTVDNRRDTTQSPVPSHDQTIAIATSKATEQATIAQRQLLKQRLADIVAREKPLKEAKLRANVEAAAIASAQAGQFTQARQTAHDLVLSPEMQAQLLAQIDAIEAKQPAAKPVLAIKQPLPNALPPNPPLPNAPPTQPKTWTPTTVSGRSLPSTLPAIPPQYSYVPQAEPQYLSYALNGFGRAIGGLGVVIDKTTTDNGATYAMGSRFNAAQWHGLRFIFPLAVPAPITSAFGWRVHPIRGDQRFHSGTDLGAPMGTPVLAADTGKVALSDWLNGYGLAVILSHNNDTQETLYGHLSEVFVKPGQVVEKGTVIGRVGSTGLSTGPHLHFELRQKTPEGWQAIDPGAQLKYALARLVKAMQSG